ncbi:MAG: hypothetical protein BWY77_01938 [bacterium ADurb.Bin431]|nr:MAG: hypothetical protein BWY77_01938 [bacterium ADurb.Bin431]
MPMARIHFQSTPPKKRIRKATPASTRTLPVSPWNSVMPAGRTAKKPILAAERKVPIGLSVRESSLASIRMSVSLANSLGCSMRPRLSWNQALTSRIALEVTSTTIRKAMMPK